MYFKILFRTTALIILSFTTSVLGQVYKTDLPKLVRTYSVFEDSLISLIEEYSGGGGTNLEPELVVTPASSKIVMDVDSVRIVGDLRILGSILSYGSGQSTYNVAIGKDALGRTNTNIFNVAIGNSALYSNTTGYGNTSIGAFSMYNNTTGYYNLALGYYSMNKNISGIGNVGIGQSALEELTTGGANTLIGYAAGLNFKTNSSNTGIGTHSLHYNKRGSYNTAIGENSFYNLVSGDYNIRIGNTPWRNPIDSLSLTDAIYIGRDVIPSNDTTINEIVIGNSITGAGNNTVTLGNSSIIATYLFGSVNIGDYTMPSVDGSSGTVIKTDGDGNLYWGSDIYGGGTGGVGHADSLTHLGRVIPGDSVVTYADGVVRYLDPSDSTAQRTYSNLLYATKKHLADSNYVLTSETTAWDKNSSNDVTTTMLGDSNYVLTSETSAWDKNSSNDRLLADTTGSGGNTATRYQHLTGLALKVNKADTTTYGSGQFATRYFTEKTYIKDGNTNWNNSYGYITGTPITYPDANTIAFGGDAIQLDPTTLEIQTGVLTAIGAATVGDTLDYTVGELDSILISAKMKWDTITSTGYVTQYDLAQFTGGGGLDNVSEDTSPTLGGDLDLNNKSLINTSPTFTVTATEVSYIDGLASNAQAQINALEDSIQALNSKFQSILDALTGCCDLSDNTPPDPVTSLVARPKSTVKDSVTWTASGSADANWYRIYRKTTTRDSTTATKIDSVAYGTNYFVNTGLTENTVYWYWIKVVDDSGNVSGWCVGDSAKTFAASSSVPVIASFRDSTQYTNTRMVLRKPTGIQSGDLLLILIGIESTTDGSKFDNTSHKPTGFTYLQGMSYNNTQTGYAVFYKKSNGTEQDTIGIPNSGGSEEGWARYMRITGADGDDPINVISADVDTAYYQGRYTKTMTAQTTDENNTLGIMLWAGWDGTTSTITISGTGWTKHSSEIMARADTFAPWGVIATKEVTSAGSTGTCTVTWTNTLRSGVGIILAINPQ